MILWGLQCCGHKETKTFYDLERRGEEREDALVKNRLIKECPKGTLTAPHLP